MVTWAFMSEGYLKRELKHDSPPSSVGGGGETTQENKINIMILVF